MGITGDCGTGGKDFSIGLCSATGSCTFIGPIISGSSVCFFFLADFRSFFRNRFIISINVTHCSTNGYIVAHFLFNFSHQKIEGQNIRIQIVWLR